MLNQITGNLITLAETGLFDVILQGCNCMNTMQSGIAREIRERYPQAQEVDSQTVQGDICKLGNYTLANCVGPSGHQFLILNCYTQYGFNRGSNNDLFEYDSFAVILRKIAALYGNKRIGTPWIGMGLAGGNPEKIIPMIEDFSVNVDQKGGTVTLVTFAA